MDLSKAKYETFLREVVSSEKLWAIWCGDTWATSNDPSGRFSALFLLWPTKQSAIESFKENKGIFPGGAIVDSIELGKWLDMYTPDLITNRACPFVVSDKELKGLIVDPVDLKRDLQSLMFRSELQGSDLTRLRRNVQRKD